jgi:hypothetical protein
MIMVLGLNIQTNPDLFLSVTVTMLKWLPRGLMGNPIPQKEVMTTTAVLNLNIKQLL